ncbi:hypothetical protein [Ralstonia pseudosolanacearum]|uniref:Uncharacterized protein n=1 Tax=Ralstonia pseudosolanacearum TaxID=1310165 RepID=A0A454TM75_9RALS|nr:hypothetical protein [Ralstonia pseudosolanacearum]RNM03245.1 hypothetical protein EGA29_19185 [Ralstonia pseudosolanacearum]
MEEWTQVSPYGWTHPSGWAIALMNVHGQAGYMLSCNAFIHGPFDKLWDAQARHAILAPSTTVREGASKEDEARCA